MTFVRTFGVFSGSLFSWGAVAKRGGKASIRSTGVAAPLCSEQPAQLYPAPTGCRAQRKSGGKGRTGDRGPGCQGEGGRLRNRRRVRGEGTGQRWMWTDRASVRPQTARALSAPRSFLGRLLSGQVSKESVKVTGWYRNGLFHRLIFGELACFRQAGVESECHQASPEAASCPEVQIVPGSWHHARASATPRWPPSTWAKKAVCVHVSMCVCM